jgi:hypothetical protein
MASTSRRLNVRIRPCRWRRATARVDEIAGPVANEKLRLKVRLGFIVMDLARHRRVGFGQKVIGRQRVIPDQNSSVVLIFQVPAAAADGQTVIRRRRALAARARLIPLSAGIAVDADFEQVPRRPIFIDLGFAQEFESRLLDRTRADVDVALGAIVPESDLLVHPARDRQADLAISFTGCRRFEFRNPSFKIRTAIASKVSSVSRLQRRSRQEGNRAHSHRSAADLRNPFHLFRPY